MKTSIIVRWQFIGFHKYKDAPKEVEFLKSLHRHLFKCSAKIEVFHEERELEFFMVQDFLRDLCKDGNMDCMSCETIARLLVQHLKIAYGANRKYEVEVSEDGENSAVVES